MKNPKNAHRSRLLWLIALAAAFGWAAAAVADHTPDPNFVTIAGSLQDELGCPGDWQPDCASTHLAYDPDDDVWQGVFSVPAGMWEYKAPLNDSWDENYGLNAEPNGANIPLALDAETGVKFYYSHDTHWVTDNVNSTIATAAGSFQGELGCPDDWQPWCLRSWLQDPDGDGLLTFRTDRLPAGDYEVKVAHDEDWAENYGAGGVPGGANIPFTVPAASTEMFFTYDPATHLLIISAGGAEGPHGNLNQARAHWVTRDTIAWNSPEAQAGDAIALHYSLDADLVLGLDGLTGGETVSLTPDPAGLPPEVIEKFPHLARYPAYRLEAEAAAMVPEMLRGQLAVSAADFGGQILDATSVQIPGVLDDLYFFDGDLGVVFDPAGVPTFKLWAPTARSVTLRLVDPGILDPPPVLHFPMSFDPATGVWSVTIDSSWYGFFYHYEVEVYAPSTGQVETNLVTDPYSVSLDADSAASQIVDLGDPAWMPAGWGELAKPALETPEDVVLYELHVRDFSWNDPTVSDENRGTFRAFTETGSNGMMHLSALAAHGLTHVHLLPAFDVATVPERREAQLEPDGDLASFPPDSEEQQARIAAVADQDGFNWGYDPWHYTVPEGSYATEPVGAQRILEFREMVQAMNRSGLRVVMDVVYNHTNSAGQNDKSVLDKIVPGYYHRLSDNGTIETSSCCPNTATEHAMMEKLMIDSLLTWARDYKVDGFRFDLMGHHPKSTMLTIRQAMDALTLADDGVDGSEIYLYGEGWNFGEVADDARFEQATQANMAGTGIGTFNDRIRDGARGGGPFSGLQEQGFLTGLFFDPNATDQGDGETQLGKLLLEQDWIRAGLAGNVADFSFVDRLGNVVTAADVDYNGQPAGYTEDPQEIVNYVAAHDNETFFDAVQLKVPLATSAADRARVQKLGLSLVVLGQGIPFVHAGQDILRSKSMDRDSFNSGDWFNRLDWTYQDNGWGSGLPAASKNQDNWPIMAPLLADPALAVSPAEISSTAQHLRELLRIRKSSRLFRLTTGDDVRNRVQFLNVGPGQVPGLIVMRVLDPEAAIDPSREQVVVAFNADDEAQAFSHPSLIGAGLELHAVQRSSADPVVRTATFDRAIGTLTVPARTAAVFEGGAAELCVPDAVTLCLGEGNRFSARVEWRDFEGHTGFGVARTIGMRDSGLFYFFDDDVLEMHVKVLDACNLEGFKNFWVFAAASTNVEYTLTVTDTLIGEVKEYTNPLGQAAPAVTDTSAFDTCP